MIYKVLPKRKNDYKERRDCLSRREPDYEASREPIDGFACASLRFSWAFWRKNVPKLTQDACFETTNLYSTKLLLLGTGSHSAVFDRGTIRD